MLRLVGGMYVRLIHLMIEFVLSQLCKMSKRTYTLIILLFSIWFSAGLTGIIISYKNIGFDVVTFKVIVLTSFGLFGLLITYWFYKKFNK